MAPWCIYISCIERVARCGSGRDVVGTMNAARSRPDWLATVQSVRKQVQSRVCTPGFRQQDGGVVMSEPFNIERGVLQGDIFSPECFIAGLDRIFRLYDQVNPGMTVGTGAHTVRMAKFEYADDAALIDEDAGQATARVTSLAAGSIADAAMIISTKKSKVMHIHKTTRTSATTEADVAKLNLVHRCESCTREFTKLRGLKMHMARWCDGGRTQRSRVGSLTDKAVKSSKRHPSTKWSSAATRHWRTCPTLITWVAGYKATGATTQTCVIAWRLRSRRLAH